MGFHPILDETRVDAFWFTIGSKGVEHRYPWRCWNADRVFRNVFSNDKSPERSEMLRLSLPIWAGWYVHGAIPTNLGVSLKRVACIDEDVNQSMCSVIIAVGCV